MNKSKAKKSDVCVDMNENNIEVSINAPVTFKLPKNKTNTKLIIVLLRLLLRKNGSNVLTFEQIAKMFGYSDRRNINNYWREFKQCNNDFISFLSRKVDLVECIPEIEDFVMDNILLPIKEIYHKFVETNSVKMSFPTFEKYFAKTCSVKMFKKMQKLLNQKLSTAGAVDILRLLANQKNVPVICDKLLENNTKNKEVPKEKSVMRSSLNRQNLCLLVHYLVASGLNLKTIALLLNVSKTTVFNLWYETENLQSIILNSIARWSGKISIDEKYIKIHGVFHFVITIVDFLTGVPLYKNVYANTRKESYEACFLTFKQIYKKDPVLIVSDGSFALKAGRLAVYPNVPHQLCKFHKIKNLFKKISECRLTETKEKWFKKKVSKAFRRKTVSGRKKGMRELITILPKPAADYVNSNIIKQWKNLSKSLTSNVSERYNRKIKKVMSGRYGLKSVKTAVNLANSLWLKELIYNGKYNLQDDSLISSLNISQICQEKLDWKNLDLLFSKKCDSVA